MRIAFIGAVESSSAALTKLIALKANIVGVLAPMQSSVNSDFCNLSLIAKPAGIPFKPINNINDAENLEWLKAKNPDIIFCIGFSQLIKKEMLSLAPMGIVGFHPALLPKNRGRHPIVWTLALGLKQTGSTFFFMDEGADSGDILNQRKVPVYRTDTARTLYSRIIKVALSQIEEFLPQLSSGRYFKRSQDHSAANYWRKRNPEDGRIDFRMTARDICNLVRALSAPYPGAHVIRNKNEYKVWSAVPKPCRLDNIECGKILKSGRSGILVKCSGGAVLLKNHSFRCLPKAGEHIL